MSNHKSESKPSQGLGYLQKAMPFTEQAQSVLPNVGKPVAPPPVSGFPMRKRSRERWATIVDNHEIRGLSVSSEDLNIQSGNNVALPEGHINNVDVSSAAANAAAKAAALRVALETAEAKAGVLKALAENDSILINDNVELIREFSNPDLGEKCDKLQTCEFAGILSKMDQMSEMQLKIILSTASTLLGVQPMVAQPSLGAASTQCVGVVGKANNLKVGATAPATNSRGRGTSRIRANPVQGGVRINKNGGRIDYDAKIYTDQHGKRYRLQTPRQKSEDRLKAEAQVQTVIRRLKSFANANSITRDCRPGDDTELGIQLKNLEDELSVAKLTLKEIKDRNKVSAPQQKLQ